MIDLTKSVGGLSNTSKMPCYSWGLPVHACKIGKRLINNPLTACYKCYADRGTYKFKSTILANERRLKLWQSL